MLDDLKPYVHGIQITAHHSYPSSTYPSETFMRVHLDEKWSDALCRFPESGMGYQRVNVLLRDGRAVRNVLVFNADEMEWPDERPIRSEDITAMTPSDD